jgi:hypothetical protein
MIPVGSAVVKMTLVPSSLSCANWPPGAISVMSLA